MIMIKRFSIYHIVENFSYHSS